MTDQRITKILNHLRSEGYAANLQPDGNISFKYNRIAMFCGTEDGDRDYCKVYVISGLDAHQISPARKACEKVMMGLKIVKVATMENAKGAAVFIGIECFHSSVDEFLKYLERCLNVAHLALEQIAQAL